MRSFVACKYFIHMNFLSVQCYHSNVYSSVVPPIDVLSNTLRLNESSNLLSRNKKFIFKNPMDTLVTLELQKSM